MGPIASGLGLAILVAVLIFTWLMVATFVSPELASFIGLFVIGFWFLVFVPNGFLQELLWQGRQKKIIKAALNAPVEYQPGTALPPPSGSSSGGLVAVGSAAGGGGSEIDIYRDLPRLPPLEPRRHMSVIKRSLVLPFVGLCMIWGGTNDLVIYKLLEARGLAQKMPIEHSKIILPNEYSEYQTDMLRAARLTVRREPECGHVQSGRLAAVSQFADAATQKGEIEDEKFLFEFSCRGPEKTNGYIAWVTPEDLNQGVIATMKKSFSRPPAQTEALTRCTEAVNKALQSRGVRAEPAMAPATENGRPAQILLQTRAGRMPFPDYLRIHGNYQIIRAGGTGGEIEVSCWVGPTDPAMVRLRKPATPPPAPIPAPEP